MNKLLTLGLILAGLLPVAAGAAVRPGDIPVDTVWYLHADLAGMRDTSSGRDLYAWLEGEVLAELNEELGIDINKEVDRVTAYSGGDAGIVVVVEGPVRSGLRDKLLAFVALESSYEIRSHGALDYYFAPDGDFEARRNRQQGDLDDGIFFSFDLPGKLLAASREEEMRKLLEREGRIAGAGSHDGALLVLTADSTFMQAGLLTGELADRDGDSWNSNILRNTEQAALLVADRNGLLAVEAQLKSRDPRMAQSLHSVINGLISLQMFNADLDPELVTLINNTKVAVEDAVLSVSTVFDPARLMRLLGN